MNNKPIVEYRAVHLDLKGVPPTFQRLLELLDIFKAGGYNALLIEWEDMFPWTVDQRFRCQSAYTIDEVKKFHKQAKAKGFEIIPLVQCLGHLETVLKLEDYASLREVADKCDCLNPLADGASDLIASMIDDVLELSGDIKYFHLGGDEAWDFGTHKDTKAFIEKYGKAKLYLQHIQPLLDKLESKGIRAILWHDMMIDWNTAALKRLGEKADLCVWGYGETPHETAAHYNVKYIERFKEASVPMWGGAAYKGADGASRDVPNPHPRRRNAIAWAKAANDYNFRGLISTAWSRYSTTRVQCEPIDACLDALLYIGWILAYEYIPADYQEQAHAKLKEIGQFEIFDKCYNLSRQLDDLRSHFWARIQEVFEQIALDKLQPTRNAFVVNMVLLDILPDFLERCKAVSEQFRAAFDGLIPQIWIDEYVDSRIIAMEHVLPKIKRTIQESLADNK